MTCEPGECRLNEDGAFIANFKKSSLFSPDAHLAFRVNKSTAFLADSLIAHTGTPPRWVLRFFRGVHRLRCGECRAKWIAHILSRAT